MPKTPLARRTTDTSGAALPALADLGLTVDVVREAIAFHVEAMRSALSTRGAVDWTARQRSADALLALARPGSAASHEPQGERAPLVSVTFAAPERNAGSDAPQPIVLDVAPEPLG